MRPFVREHGCRAGEKRRVAAVKRCTNQVAVVAVNMPNRPRPANAGGPRPAKLANLAWRCALKSIESPRNRRQKACRTSAPPQKHQDRCTAPTNQNGTHRRAWDKPRSGFQNPLALWSCQTPPARMRCSHPLAFGITHQHRQTIGHHDGASHLCPLGPAGIGHRTIRAGTGQMDGMDAMHLF
jgi:hypothetical protein